MPYLEEENGRVTIVGIPLVVERIVTYTPKTNEKGNAMNELILNALKAAGIEVADLDDAALFAKYNELLATNEQSTASASEGTAIAEAITNALEPVVNRLEAIEAGQTAKTDAERDVYAKQVAESGLYPNLDLESAKCLPVEKLKEMAANCTPSFGIPLTQVANSSEAESLSTDMPE